MSYRLWFQEEILAFFSGKPVEYIHHGTHEWLPLVDANLFNNEKVNFRIKPQSSKCTVKKIFVFKDGTHSIVDDPLKEKFATVVIYVYNDGVEMVEVER